MWRRWVAIAGIAVAAAGCARQGPITPSFAGLADMSVADDPETGALPETEPASESVRHVRSSKVLGALAYQKVTGRTIDPSRLSGR